MGQCASSEKPRPVAAPRAAAAAPHKVVSSPPSSSDLSSSTEDELNVVLGMAESTMMMVGVLEGALQQVGGEKVVIEVMKGGQGAWKTFSDATASVSGVTVKDEAVLRYEDSFKGTVRSVAPLLTGSFRITNSTSTVEMIANLIAETSGEGHTIYTTLVSQGNVSTPSPEPYQAFTKSSHYKTKSLAHALHSFKTLMYNTVEFVIGQAQKDAEEAAQTVFPEDEERLLRTAKSNLTEGEVEGEKGGEFYDVVG